MKKIEGQMSFDISPEEQKPEEAEKQLNDKEPDKPEEEGGKETEDRIKVESVERAIDELTGELCYRIVLFWEVIQRPLSFFFYPKDGKVIWTSRPDFHISDTWWDIITKRVRAVGSDHYRRNKKEIEGKA